jgi:hypothetical protein
MCYKGSLNGIQKGNLEEILNDFLSANWRLQLALHEGGIVSNRGSARHGEWSGALYTPPVTSGESVWLEGVARKFYSVYYEQVLLVFVDLRVFGSPDRRIGNRDEVVTR